MLELTVKCIRSQGGTHLVDVEAGLSVDHTIDRISVFSCYLCCDIAAYEVEQVVINRTFVRLSPLQREILQDLALFASQRTWTALIWDGTWEQDCDTIDALDITAFNFDYTDDADPNP